MIYSLYNTNICQAFVAVGAHVRVVQYTFSNASSEATAIESADLNGDGLADVVVSGLISGTISVHLNQGSGTFGAATTYTTGSGSEGLTLGDINGDGALDIVQSGYYGNVTNVLLGNATTTTNTPELDFSTQASARLSLNTLQSQSVDLGKEIGRIGAAQSRLEVAFNVVGSLRENSAAAESRIRDTDIAQESANLIRLQILQLAGTAVLAQANQQPSLALRLLESI